MTPGGAIGAGLCVLLGVAEATTPPTAAGSRGRSPALRVFENDEGKFDRSLLDVGGEALVVSQFTLMADTRQRETGRASPEAARPEVAEPLYEQFCAELRALGTVVATGVFGARMEVELVERRPRDDRARHLTRAGSRRARNRPPICRALCYRSVTTFRHFEMGASRPFFM